MDNNLPHSLPSDLWENPNFSVFMGTIWHRHKLKVCRASVSGIQRHEGAFAEILRSKFPLEARVQCMEEV
jgi:hypothetical protein